MTLQEIKTAVDSGLAVHWKSLPYKVIKDHNDQYFISVSNGKHYIGLTWEDGKTLNGKEQDFFISKFK